MKYLVKGFGRFINEQDEQYVEAALENELTAEKNPMYHKAIADLIKWSKESELGGKFSRHSKIPNKFKYDYTHRRSGELNVIEFTMEEFLTFSRVMDQMTKHQNIIEKFQEME